jgi:hypothetical protein
MLSRILIEIEASAGALTLSELQSRLEIERSALEGMLQHLVRTGRLLDEDAASANLGEVCGSGGCGASCSGTSGCSFIAKMPKTLSLQKGKTKHHPVE